MMVCGRSPDQRLPPPRRIADQPDLT